MKSSKLSNVNSVKQPNRISSVQSDIAVDNNIGNNVGNNLVLKNILPYGLLLLAMSISLIRYMTSIPPVIDNIEEVDKQNTNITQEEMAEDELNEMLTEDEMDESEDDVSYETERTENIITLGQGDTLAKVLEQVGINKTDIQNVATAISRIFPLRKIKAGQQILIKTNDNDKTSLKSLEMKPTEQYKVIAEKSGKRFIAKKVLIPLKRSVKSISGVLSPKSPKSSLRQCGVRSKIANDALNALGQVININHTKAKVNFDLVYEQYCTDAGKVLDSNLLAIVASIEGKLKKIYKFSVDGSMQYIDANGTVLSSQKCEKMFIQPIIYKKITSKFGYRTHPISGRGKMHTGVDLAASIGTPVRAAASGIVVKACNYSGYGKYIKIKHSERYSSAYAHLSRVVVCSGQYVKQGQIIGYSGNSGYSTGAHLHYELMQNGKFINPLMFVPKPLRKLTGKQLIQFNAFKNSIKLRTPTGIKT